MKYIKSALAILLAGTLLCGCEEKASDDSDISGCWSVVTADTSDYNFFETADGLYSFGAPPTLASREDDSGSDYEYSFTTGKENSLIGVMSVSGYHQTAEGFGKGTLADYEELYSEVSGENIDFGDVPAYQITAFSENIVYVSTMLQYGNGDLFVVNTTDDRDNNDAAKAAAALCSTIEYKGEPLKTSPETYENDYFSITAPEKWYFKSKDGESVTVTLNDGKTFPAQIIGGDKDYDIAVIKVDPGDTKLKPVTLGTSSSLKVGDDVVTIGNPLGELTFSMAEGIVSCLNREINLQGTPFNMIQISTAVNSGNSGGPLFNIYGEVVGIVSAKYSSNSSYSSEATIEGLGFAIPLDDVLSMIEDIMTNGQVTTHAYVGVSVSNASAYPETGVRSGGYLAEVVKGGPADKAGLQVGDVITMVGTTTITSSSDLTSVLGSKSYKAGDTATVTYVRGGQVYTTELTFGSTTEKPAETSTPSQSQQTPQQNQTAPQQGTSDGYYDDYYGDMEDFFNQFFGGYGFGGRGAA